MTEIFQLMEAFMKSPSALVFSLIAYCALSFLRKKKKKGLNYMSSLGYCSLIGAGVLLAWVAKLLLG